MINNIGSGEANFLPGLEIVLWVAHIETVPKNFFVRVRVIGLCLYYSGLDDDVA